MEAFSDFRKQSLPLIEKEMENFINEYTANDQLKEAMLYSIHAGGKRFRPLLVLATIRSFNKKAQTHDYQVAAALEMIHTYSLIHDDLPAMDDDDLRRGKPTNHKVFGEAQAILAGDGLLTAAFQLVALSQIESNQKILLIQILSKAAGTQGMVAGQAGDLQGEKRSLSLSELANVHEKKTGALIEFALLAGGILAEQPEEIVDLLGIFAQHLGLAFQIKDDLLDATSTEEELGKQVGRDEALNKSTYPNLLGLEGAKEALNEQLTKGSNTLKAIKETSSEFHSELLQELLEQLQL
ncbi:geranyl transferase [Enterococcus plantarum]|uniref:Farnesyl diphosphate synthase n=1 Tax=Enterococcus plantarum TaxID=1077675 RepID=A0A2W4BDG5_9ENTE|nr:farnesyl diphosphate synthase [Enterococcus plantarum]MBO0422655.1 polyprenyl synthetase family protein [Enterococcus plantarum]MBO0467702.1 polyprenyl synthetase family protein [Enterococcus plantarum]OEG09309.1 geranyl transferase [Enterococcus plantarum]PZL70982.1 polyprenyl synthetase family protein [Enterococcus plantarum]